MIASNWRRVNRQGPCSICGKPDWCLVSTDGTAICARVESNRRAGEAGYLHRLTESHHHGWQAPPSITLHRSTVDHADLAARFQATAEKAGKLEPLARQLGVSVASLRRLRVGWCWPESCSTWPMADANGRRVIGIVRRFYKGCDDQWNRIIR